jgi:hypothetical protein
MCSNVTDRIRRLLINTYLVHSYVPRGNALGVHIVTTASSHDNMFVYTMPSGTKPHVTTKSFRKFTILVALV